jgi:hypothetical protein
MENERRTNAGRGIPDVRRVRPLILLDLKTKTLEYARRPFMFHYLGFGCFRPPQRADPNRRLYRKRYELSQVVPDSLEAVLSGYFLSFSLSAVRKSLCRPLVFESARWSNRKNEI